MSIKLVIFDMAGTTVEDKDNVHQALIDSFLKFNMIITREEANSVMGIPKPVAIQTILTKKFKQEENEITFKLRDDIHSAFVEEMLAFYKNDPSVKSAKNAETTFAALKEIGILVGIDTGFSRDIAEAIIDRLEWREMQLIDYSVTSDEVANGRPFPDMIFKAMEDLNISSPQEIAKVGDTISDLKEGTSAGCKYVIGITTGAYSESELAETPHTHLIKNLWEVVKIVTA